MKLYISADIEGVACISAQPETDMSQPDYPPFRRQMTAEVAAACEGAAAAGAKHIVIKDAHWTGRNIDPHSLPAQEGVTLQLIRGWSGHPLAMVQGIDSSFDAAVFIGYHSAAGNGGNPLAHTLSGRHFASVEINGIPASEFLVYAYAAASVGVPVAFLSGDKALCEEAAAQVDGLVCVATLEGQGASTISVSPADALHKIRRGVQQALEAPLPQPPQLPSAFAVRIGFKNASDAYAKAFYPGASQLSARDVGFETDTYFEVLRFLWFMAQ